MQTLDAIGLSGADLTYAVPATPLNEAWIPVRKFKHGKWKVKWKEYHRGSGDEEADEDQQAYRGHRWQDHY